MELSLLVSGSSAMRAAQTEAILKCNEISQRYGQALTPRQARAVAEAQQAALVATHRVEFGTALMPKLIYAFCDSPFIPPAAYADTLSELMSLFYHYKNQTGAALSDDELLSFMAEAFNSRCQGSLELLAHRELETLARHLREGKSPHTATGLCVAPYAEEPGEEGNDE